MRDGDVVVAALAGIHATAFRSLRVSSERVPSTPTCCCRPPASTSTRCASCAPVPTCGASRTSRRRHRRNLARLLPTARCSRRPVRLGAPGQCSVARRPRRPRRTAPRLSIGSATARRARGGRRPGDLVIGHVERGVEGARRQGDRRARERVPGRPAGADRRGLPVAAVASSTSGAPALARAEAAGAETAVFALEAYPDRDAVTRRWPSGSRAVVCRSSSAPATCTSCAPSSSSASRTSVVNVHPAPPALVPGAHAVEDASLRDGETGRASTSSTKGSTPGRCCAGGGARAAGDTPETLHARIRAVEHRLLPEVRAGAGSRHEARAPLHVRQDGVAAFAEELRRLDFELVASGGTARVLAGQRHRRDPARAADRFAEMLGTGS